MTPIPALGKFVPATEDEIKRLLDDHRRLAQKNANLKSSHQSLVDALDAAVRWLSGMHSETIDGAEHELRDVHSAAWESIDMMRDTLSKAKGES